MHTTIDLFVTIDLFRLNLWRQGYDNFFCKCKGTDLNWLLKRSCGNSMAICFSYLTDANKSSR